MRDRPKEGGSAGPGNFYILGRTSNKELKMAKRQNGSTYRASSTSSKDVTKRTYRNGKLVREQTIRRSQMPKSARLGGNG